MNVTGGDRTAAGLESNRDQTPLLMHMDRCSLLAARSCPCPCPSPLEGMIGSLMFQSRLPGTKMKRQQSATSTTAIQKRHMSARRLSNFL